jgi:hypothetical protein
VKVEPLHNCPEDLGFLEYYYITYQARCLSKIMFANLWQIWIVITAAMGLVIPMWDTPMHIATS